MAKTLDSKAVILAGGQGTRLWPISRKAKPKQFQKLAGKKTMLQETFQRLLPVFSINNIFISTNKEYFEEVKSELPALPLKNIIVEPERRERVAAIALFLAKIGGDQPILLLPSDHLIKDEKGFASVVSSGEKFIRNNKNFILTFGEKPTFPDTGLGYIKKGKVLEENAKGNIHQVEFFKEKPNLNRAKSFLKSKEYLWNTGFYFFYPNLMEKLIKKYVRDNYERYLKIKQALGKPDFKAVLQEEYQKMDIVSLEYSIIENYNDVAVLPVNIGWSDIGSWAVLKDCLSQPGANFVKGNYIGVDSKNIMVYGSQSKLVASVGVKDLVIAVTDDIILICHRDGSQKIREVIKKLEKDKKFSQYI